MVGKSILTPRRSAALVLITGTTLLAGVWAGRLPARMPPNSFASAKPSAAAAGWTGRAAGETATAAAHIDVDALVRELIDRGRAALADGDLRAGFDAYRRAVEYTPTAETHGLVGDLYLRAAVASEAIFHLRRAAELDPENADRWIALANAYMLQTDLGASWKAIARAREIEPEITIERDRNNFVVRGHAG